jgi:hypothetical protein
MKKLLLITALGFIGTVAASDGNRTPELTFTKPTPKPSPLKQSRVAHLNPEKLNVSISSSFGSLVDVTPGSEINSPLAVFSVNPANRIAAVCTPMSCMSSRASVSTPLASSFAAVAANGESTADYLIAWANAQDIKQNIEQCEEAAVNERLLNKEREAFSAICNLFAKNYRKIESRDKQQLKAQELIDARLNAVQAWAQSFNGFDVQATAYCPYTGEMFDTRTGETISQ